MTRPYRALIALMLIAVCLSTVALAKDTPTPSKTPAKTATKKKQRAKKFALLKASDMKQWGHFLVQEKDSKKVPKKADVWSFKKGVLSCKGVPMGYLSTKQKFNDFKLTFQWRWPKGVKPTNSGVFVRLTGKDRALPKCVEVQLCHKKAGDLIGFHGIKLKGPSDRTVKKKNELGGAVTILSKKSDTELPPGKWNYGKVIAKGDTITVWINGRKVNQASGLPTGPGKIALQSEGGLIEFKTVIIRNLK